jgi:tRNA threonylcarbamoyladenosine biosynthesis protein TsaB
MPSLSQILIEQSPLLLIDAASEMVQVGLLQGGIQPRWCSRKEEAGVGVFECIDELDVDLGSVRAFVFCEGPGSILGIRTSAMALRMWTAMASRPVYGYLSLAIVATACARPGVTVIADARRGLWHRLSQGGPLGRVPASDLSGDLVMPEGFRHWCPVPPGTLTASYDLASLFSLHCVAEADLLHEAPSPDAFLHQEPAYAKWTPQIHRAP